MPEKPKTPQQLWYNHEKKIYLKVRPDVSRVGGSEREPAGRWPRRWRTGGGNEKHPGGGTGWKTALGAPHSWMEVRRGSAQLEEAQGVQTPVLFACSLTAG